MKIILAACLLLSGNTFAAESEITGCVYSRSGLVEMAEGNDWRPLTGPEEIKRGTILRTGPDGSAELLLSDGSFISVGKNAEITAEELLLEAGSRKFSFSLLRGKVLWLAARAKKAAEAKFEVRTPSLVCAVRGTDFAVEVSSSGEAVAGLFEGEVEVSADGQTGILTPGSEASLNHGLLSIADGLSPAMAAQLRQRDRLSARVSRLREKLERNRNFLYDYLGRREKALQGLRSRQKESLNKRFSEKRK